MQTWEAERKCHPRVAAEAPSVASAGLRAGPPLTRDTEEPPRPTRPPSPVTWTMLPPSQGRWGLVVGTAQASITSPEVGWTILPPEEGRPPSPPRAAGAGPLPGHRPAKERSIRTGPAHTAGSSSPGGQEHLRAAGPWSLFSGADTVRLGRAEMLALGPAPHHRRTGPQGSATAGVSNLIQNTV